MVQQDKDGADRFADRKYLLDDILDDDPDLQSGRTYLDRILDAYVDMRSSTRSFIETKPSEARLLFLTLFSFLPDQSLWWSLRQLRYKRACLPTSVLALLSLSLSEPRCSM